MVPIPVNRALNSLLEADFRGPSEMAEFGDVQQFLRGSIGLGGIPEGVPGEADSVRDGVGDLPNGDVGPAADIDVLGPVIVLQQVQTGIRQIVGVQEFPPWRPGAPVGH